VIVLVPDAVVNASYRATPTVVNLSFQPAPGEVDYYR